MLTDVEGLFVVSVTVGVGLAANLSGNYEDFTAEILQGYGTMFDYEYPDSDLMFSSQHGPGLDIDVVTMARPPVVCKPMPGKLTTCRCPFHVYGRSFERVKFSFIFQTTNQLQHVEDCCWYL